MIAIEQLQVFEINVVNEQEMEEWKIWIVEPWIQALASYIFNRNITSF